MCHIMQSDKDLFADMTIYGEIRERSVRHETGEDMCDTTLAAADIEYLSNQSLTEECRIRLVSSVRSFSNIVQHSTSGLLIETN